MASILVKCGALAGISAFCESKYGPILAATGPGGLSPLFAATPLVLIGVGFFTLIHGFEVGKARTKYADLAKKDGEKDVNERFNLPNLYAQGTSKHVLAFNCVQRSHQHIFENFTSVAIMGLAGALSFPIATAASTLMYAIGRVIMSKCYAAGADAGGDASKRYSSPLSSYMWYGLVTTMALGIISCVKILATSKLVVVVE